MESAGVKVISGVALVELAGLLGALALMMVDMPALFLGVVAVVVGTRVLRVMAVSMAIGVHVHAQGTATLGSTVDGAAGGLTPDAPSGCLVLLGSHDR